MNTLYRIGLAVIFVLFIATGILKIHTQPAMAAPISGVVMSEYKIGRTTIYEWRTHHKRLCTMVVDQYASNAPVISCN